MNKSFWLTTLLCALSIGAFTTVYGQGYLTSNTIIVFSVLTLLVPPLVRKWGRWPWLRDYEMSEWCHLYAWLWWTLFFYIGAGGVVSLNIDTSNRLVVGGLWFITYMLIVILISLCSSLLTLLLRRPHTKGIVDDIIDMAVYALPIPVLIMGNILYVDALTLALVIGAQQAMVTLLSYINIAIMVTLAIHMIVFAIYLYPKQGDHRSFRLLRIVITAFMWLAMTAHIVGGGYVPPFLTEWTTAIVFKNNGLVYALVGVVECIILAIAVIIGYYIEKWLVNRFAK